MVKIKVFAYDQSLDAFLVRPEFASISKELGLTEWHPVVWLGRLFCMDNDYGEHWFDNWAERDKLEDTHGVDSERLMIIRPSRFCDHENGPCHTDEIRKMFWTNVLEDLRLDLELLFVQARRENLKRHEMDLGDYIQDLESVIQRIEAKYS